MQIDPCGVTLKVIRSPTGQRVVSNTFSLFGLFLFHTDISKFTQGESQTRDETRGSADVW